MTQTPSILHKHFPKLRAFIAPGSPATDLIAASGLPPEIQSALTQLIKKTRLKRREKSAVANELISHFTDTLASGTSPADALADFGDLRTAAKLIRRATIRKRSALWHTFRVARYVAGGLVVVYLGLSAIYFSGKPKPSVDYIARLNAPTLASPEADRAWPIYRQVCLELNLRGTGSTPPVPYDVLFARPPNPQFPELVSFVHARHEVIATLRAATTRPRLGFVLGATGSAEDQELFPNLQKPAPVTALEGSLFETLLPQVNQLRALAHLLRADCSVAISENDGTRALANIDALFGMAVHAGDSGVLVSQLVSVGIRAQGLECVDELLQNNPGALSDDELRTLAHQLAKPRSAADLLTFAGERNFFYDVVQRTYTDNGQGDGHLATNAAEALSLGKGKNSANRLVQFLGAGAIPLFTASRKDLVAKYDQYLDRVEANLHRPLRDGDSNVLERELAESGTGVRERLKYLPLYILLPSLARVHETAENCLAQYEALTIAIALELHHRRHGTYPATLYELTPDLLPQIPTDRITGKPLSYRLNHGKPVIYSWGEDLTDDQGVPPTDKDGQPAPRLAARWPTPLPKGIQRAPIKGDWLLYPTPKE